MSALEKLAAIQTGEIKKYYPAAQTGYLRKTGNVGTTYTVGASDANHQTDSTGIVELTISVPLNTAQGGTGTHTGVLICFGAASDGSAKAILDDATTDADTVQYRFINPGTTRTFHFSPAITRWDMKALTAATPIYQEKAR